MKLEQLILENTNMSCNILIASLNLVLLKEFVDYYEDENFLNISLKNSKSILLFLCGLYWFLHWYPFPILFIPISMNFMHTTYKGRVMSCAIAQLWHRHLSDLIHFTLFLPYFYMNECLSVWKSPQYCGNDNGRHSTTNMPQT